MNRAMHVMWVYVRREQSLIACALLSRCFAFVNRLGFFLFILCFSFFFLPRLLHFCRMFKNFAIDFRVCDSDAEHVSLLNREAMLKK